MYKIKKKFNFAYAHILDLPYKSPCTNIHGHNAKVIITLSSEILNSNGMIIDFSKLSVIVNELLDSMDHALIIARKNKIQITKPERNKVYYLPYKQSTAENFAKHIYNQLKKQVIFNDMKIEVKFYETENNAAVYTETIKSDLKVTSTEIPNILTKNNVIENTKKQNKEPLISSFIDKKSKFKSIHDEGFKDCTNYIEIKPKIDKMKIAKILHEDILLIYTENYVTSYYLFNNLSNDDKLLIQTSTKLYSRGSLMPLINKIENEWKKFKLDITSLNNINVSIYTVRFNN